jgi:Fic family protein
MKMPKSPPALDKLYAAAAEDGRLPQIWAAVRGPTHKGKYLHWDKLRRLDPPDDLSHSEWWLGLKLHRLGLRKPVGLVSTSGREFSFIQPDPIPQRLHDIDQSGGGSIEMPEHITNPDTRDRYIVNSLIEEAITSSQLEGAATTRPIAKEMIRTGRAPRDRSEQMILNNYRTMQYIRDLKKEPLTPGLVCEIQRRVTMNALDDPSAAGRLRRSDEPVDVSDEYGGVYHVPPVARELEHRMETMCEFANEKIPKTFVHPVIRSILLHFWLAYDHPFKDGNGRTARALFYWSMLRHGYWMCEFISISQIIRRSPAQYYRAFLYTETDDNDLTYFLLHQVEILRRAIKQLHEYIKRKTTELRMLEQELRGMRFLNHRQRALISHALRHADARYTIRSHQSSHDVVYETARSDLMDLADRGLLDRRKMGRTWVFSPARDLHARLIADDE